MVVVQENIHSSLSVHVPVMINIFNWFVGKETLNLSKNSFISAILERTGAEHSNKLVFFPFKCSCPEQNFIHVLYSKG